VSDQTILQSPPSTLDEDELTDALRVAPPSVRSRRVTRVLSALLLVAVGATGATWWAERPGAATAGTGRLPFAEGGALPGGFPAGAPGDGVPGTTGTGPTGATGTGATGASGDAAAAAGTTGEVVLVDGAKVYVRTSTGAVVTVTTNDSTKVSRSAPSSVAELAAGDTVTVAGTTTSSGVTATAITAS
jgi:hypothetical protein